MYFYLFKFMLIGMLIMSLNYKKKSLVRNKVMSFRVNYRSTSFALNVELSMGEKKKETNCPSKHQTIIVHRF